MAGTVSIDAVPVTFSDTVGSADLNTESSAGTTKISANNEQNIHVAGRIIISSPDAKKHLDNGHDNQNNFSHQMELNVEAVQSDKSLADELSVKPCGTENDNNDAMEIDEAVDKSNVKPGDCSGSDKVLFDDDNPLHANAQDISSADCVSSEVCRSPAAVTENDDRELELDNDGSFDMVNIMENEVMLPSEFDLPAENEQKSDDQISYEYNVAEHNSYDEELKSGDDGLTYGSGSGHADDDEDGVEDLGSLEESSAASYREEESFGVTMNKMEHKVSDFQLEGGLDTDFSPPCADQQAETEIMSKMGHRVSDFQLEGGLDTNFSPPCADQQAETEIMSKMEHRVSDFQLERELDTNFTPSCADQQAETEMQKQTHDFPGVVSQTEVDLCSESNVLCFPRDYVSNYIGDEAVRGSDVGIVQPTGIRDFQFEKTSSPEVSTMEALNKEGEDRVSSLFFTSGSSDTQLEGRTNKSHSGISNELGGFTGFVGDKQAQVSKSLLSCLSMNEQNHGVAKSDVRNVSSTTTTMHFPGLDKVESSRSDKSTLDFSNMTGINERFVTSVQHNTVREESSPFQLWGQQSCSLQGSQSKVYGDVGGGAQRNRSSNNNSLNLVGLQRPSGGGNNLNEVRMNERNYAQHSETGVFSSSNEARRDGNFHGNTLNLAGFSQQYESGYNYNKPCINQQSYGTQHAESGGYSRCDQDRAAYGNSLTLASVQQCDTRYNMNNTSQQTIDPGYSLNKGYIDSIQGLSKLDNLENSRDRDLMIGFGNSGGRPNQTAPTEFLWRSTEGNILPGGLVDSSSSQGQSSGSFQAFDFLSDKSGNDLYSANDKFDNMSSFEGLRSSVEPMEFSFMTTQESNTQMEHPKVLQYNAEMDPSFANMMAGHVFTTLCVWCGNEFQQDPLACEMQAGSIGYLCPNCKARMSGQFL